MNEEIPMSSVEMDDSDMQAVLEVLSTGRLSLGPKIEEFERRIAEYVGVKYAVAVSSGTAALHAIVRALSLGPGDEVLVPSFTFAASVNPILYEGAIPVFVDIEPDTFNVDPVDLERKITRRTRALVAVDVFGHPAEWNEIQRIADRHGLRVIDDCCEALGAEYRGKSLGQMGNAAAFSFYPNKVMTTGEGGMIVTDDEDLYRLSRCLRNQGRGEMGAWLQHEQLGYNYRIDEMSAALGISQLKRIETFLEKRKRVAQMYTKLLCDMELVRPPIVKPHVRPNWFVYVVTLTEGLNRDVVMRSMEAQGIQVRGYFAPMHMQPYIREKFDFQEGGLPVTESVGRRTVAIPFHNNLTEFQVERVVAALREAVREAASIRQT